MSEQDEFGELEQTLPQKKDFDRKEKEEILDNITPTQNNTSYQSSTPPQNNTHQIKIKSLNQNQTQSEIKDGIHTENIQTDSIKITVGDNISQSDKTNFSEEQNQEEQSFSAWGQLNDQTENVELGQGQGKQAGWGQEVQGQGQGQVQDQLEIHENADDWEDFGEFESKPSFENHDQISKPVSGFNSPIESTSLNTAGKGGNNQVHVNNAEQNDFVENIQTSFETQAQKIEDQSQFSNSQFNQEQSFDGDFDEFEDFQEDEDNHIEQSKISDYYNANQEIQNTKGGNFDGEEDFGYSDQDNVSQPQNQNIFQSTSDMHTQNVAMQNVQDAQHVGVGQEFENLEEMGNSQGELQPQISKQTLENQISEDQICDEFDDFGEFQEENLVSQQSFQLGQTSQDDAHVQNVQNVPVDSEIAEIDDGNDDGFGDFNENDQFSAFEKQNQNGNQNEQNGNDDDDDEFGDFDEGVKEPPSDSQNLKHPNQQISQNIQTEQNDNNLDDDYDDFGDFNEGDEAPPSNSQQITSQNQQQQFQQENNFNFDDDEDDDFGGFNEGDKILPQNSSQQQQQQNLNSEDSQQQKSDDFDDDDDFGDFNEGDENQTPTSTPTPTPQNQQQEKLEKSQQQQQQFQQQQNSRQLDLLNMSQNKFSEAVNRLFSAVSQNLQKQSTQQVQSFDPNSNIQQISLDSYSNQLINEWQNQLKNLFSQKNSAPTFSSEQHENNKLNWSGSNSENRLLQNLNLTDLAQEAKELEIQKQIQKSQRKLKLREKSWKIPSSRRRSKDDLKNNNNQNQNQKNIINQEDSVNKQQRIISNYLKQNSVLPRDSSGDPFAASGPVWNLEADMEGVQGVGSVERGGGVVASSSSISAIHDDPFAFIFAGQQQSQNSAFNSGTTVDVSELDDFFSFSVDNTPTASATQARADPFAFSGQSNTHLNAQLDTLQTVDFGDFSSEKSKELEDAPETSKAGDDKQEVLNKMLSSLPDLSFMLSRDVRIQKSSSKK